MLNVGDMLGHVPLPAKITIDVLEPIDLREEFGEDPDLGEVYDEVLGRMQAALTALQAERRLPRARLMRVERTRTIDAPRELIWERVRDPASYPRFVDGITRCDPKGHADPVDGQGPPATDREPGLGSRFSMRMKVGSADVGGIVELVEFDEPGDLSWTNVTGIDQRGRWRLRETSDGRTRVTLRLSYDAPGGVLGMISDRVSAPMVGRNFERTLENLQREFEGGETELAEPGKGLTGRIGYALGSAKVLAEAGVIRPIRPDKLVKVLTTLARFGRSPAAGTISLAARYPGRDDDRGRARHAHVRRGAPAHQRPGPRPLRRRASRRATAWGSCAATTAASSSRPWPCRSSAATRSTSTPPSPGPQLTEVVKREKPVAIIYDEEFAGLLAEAGKRRKRFVAWHDSERTADPTLDELIENGRPRRRGGALARGPRGDPHLRAPPARRRGRRAATRRRSTRPCRCSTRIPLRTRQTVHIAAPLFHSWGFAHYTLGLILGSTYVLRRKFDPEACLAEVARTRAEVLAVVPVMMQRILELPEDVRRKYDVSSLKVVAASGSALPGDLATDWMNEFGDNLYNLYGSTEVAWASIATPEHMRAAPGTAGTPPRGTIVRLYDERGRPTPTGRDRAHLRGQRDALRGLHRRRLEGRDRRPHGHRRRGPLRPRRAPVRGGPRRRDDRVRGRERLPRRDRGHAGAPPVASARPPRSASRTRTSASGCGRSSCWSRARRRPRTT